jgi:hypothetical protein
MKMASEPLSPEQIQKIEELIQGAYQKGRSEAAAIADEQKYHHDYYHQRWTQLNELVGNYADMCMKYLFTTNLAAAGGVITFMGAVAELRTFSWPYWAFFIFSMGVVCTGVLKVFLLHRTEGLMQGCTVDYGRLIRREIDWATFLAADEARVAVKKQVPYILGYSAFGAFIIGVTLVMINIYAGKVPGTQQAAALVAPATNSPCTTTDSGRIIVIR